MKIYKQDFSDLSIREHLLGQMRKVFSEASPRETLKLVYEMFGEDAVMATGFGASGVVMMHMLSTILPDPKVFYLDTDLLFPETYALRDRLADELGISFIRVHGGMSVSAQQLRYGDDLWDKAPDTCCFIRKVAPLRHFLSSKVAWITGIRRDQALSRRSAQVVEWDQANGLLKFNPLVTWTEEDIWSYIRLNDIPYNELHDAGYPSIGCMPCTGVPEAGESLRAGRWAGRDKMECGIHVQP